MKIGELHWSALKMMAKSPAHFRSYIEEGSDPTRAMQRGTLVHVLVLGGDVAVYEGERRGKAWDAFEAEHEGRFIATRKEYDRARRCADAVANHPVAGPLLVGRTEDEWHVTMYGRPCAGRIDCSGWLHTTDLKTTVDASPERFKRQSLYMGWHAQLDWYQEARRAMKQDPGGAYIVGVETKEPFAVTVLRVTDRALLEGRKLNRLWLERLAACEAANEWPAYVQTPVDLDIVEDAELIFGDEEAA